MSTRFHIGYMYVTFITFKYHFIHSVAPSFYFSKRNIKPRVQSDFHTTNIVEKFSTNHSECFKIPEFTQNNIETHSLLELLVSGTNWKRVTSAQRQLTASEKLSISATNFYSAHTAVVDARIGFYR